MPKPDKPAPSVKHPHVRGEDRLSDDETPPTAETPPRAWGRRALLKKANDIFGNTPTCVGKTIQRKNVKNERRKHPHVRGEDTSITVRAIIVVETPPRAWGRPRKALEWTGGARNTPTCVGKTQHESGSFYPRRKHPHVRGEDVFRATGRALLLETPPRAWGRRKPSP